MTSRERVLTTFAHREPDRVPRWCGASIEFWAKARAALGLDDEGLRRRFGDDFRRADAPYRLGDQPLSSGAVSRTVFGIERAGIGYGQPLTHPLAEARSVADVESWPWPDPSCVDTTNVRREAEQWNREYAVLGGHWTPFWHDAIDLMGMEALYMKMYDAPDVIDAMLDRVVSFYVEANSRVFDVAADVMDIFFIANDFGSQTGPLMSLECFQRFLLSPLKRLIDLGHRYNLLVQLHSCGGFEPLIPSMIEAGLDGLHAVQPCCRGMDLTALKRNYGDRIVFNGAVDSQHVLIEGPSPEFVKEKTREALRIMAPGGGYVAGASHDAILEETPLENVLAMFDAIEEYGVYPVR